MRPDRKDYQALAATAADGRLALRATGPDRHRGLGHEPEQAVHPALVRGRHREVGVHPDVRERVQPKRTMRVWRFHQSSIQGSRSVAAWSASACARSRPSAMRTPHVERVAARIVAGHGDAPLAVGEPPHGERVGLDGEVRVHLVDGGHSGRVRGRCAHWCNG